MFYLLITFFVITLGIIYKNSKFVFASLYLVLLIIAVNFWSGYDISNYQLNYESEYLIGDSEDRSVIFAFLMIICKNAGLTFLQFRAICFLLWSAAIVTVIRNFGRFPNFVFAACMIFPLLSFGSQMRNGVAVACIYWAIFLLLKYHNKKGNILYILLVCLAGFVHNAAFIYLTGIIAASKLSTKTIRSFSIIGMFSLLVIIFSGSLISVFGYIGGSQVDSYYGIVHLLNGAEFNILVHPFLIIGILINLMFSYLSASHINKNRTDYAQSQLIFAQFTYRLNYVLLTFVPLLFVSGSFYRIYQNLFILTVISLSNASSTYIAQGKFQGHLLRGAFLIFYFFVTYYYCWWQGEFIPLFNSIYI